MFISILLFVIFAACFAALMKGGLWSNTLALINVVSAGLLATNYFEPLADWFDKQEPAYHYVWDFMALWLIFGISMTVFRVLTDAMSQVKVRFFMPVEKVGGALLAAWTAWVVVCFTTMTLHTAPLARNFMSFQAEPTTKMLFGLGPDRQWLAWVRRESMGSMCRWGQIVPFDPNADFVLRYGNRREEFEKQLTLAKSAAPAAMPK